MKKRCKDVECCYLDDPLSHGCTKCGLPPPASPPASRPLTIHQRIMRAAGRGTGVRLTADDVRALSYDDAISTRAELDSCDSCYQQGKQYSCRHPHDTLASMVTNG